jgi:hypothetical protein
MTKNDGSVKKYQAVHTVAFGKQVHYPGSVFEAPEKDAAGFLRSGYIVVAPAEAELFEAPNPKVA